MPKVSKKVKRVRMDELGLFLSTIALDHKTRDNRERAELVSKYFNVLCLEEDVDNYERLLREYDYITHEDFELESRKQAHFLTISVLFV